MCFPKSAFALLLKNTPKQRACQSSAVTKISTEYIPLFCNLTVDNLQGLEYHDERKEAMTPFGYDYLSVIASYFC